MARYVAFLVLVSLALLAAGKVIHNSDLLDALERVVRKESRGEGLNRFDLEHRSDDEEGEVDLHDDSQAAVLLSEDSQIKYMRDGGDDGDGGDNGDLVDSEARDMLETQTRGEDEGPAVMSKRDRAPLQYDRQADRHNVGGDDGDSEDLVESSERDVIQTGAGASDGRPAVMSKRGRDPVKNSRMTNSRDDGNGEENENGGVIDATDPESPDSDKKSFESDSNKRDITIPKTDGNALDNIIRINSEVGVDKRYTEGDIRAPPSRNRGSLKRDATNNPHMKWPSSGNYIILPYITSGLNANALSALRGAIDNIQRISCVRIVPRTSEGSYINVFPGGGCWSYIGKVGGKQDVSLGSGCEHVRIATHELLHALGFWHEQSRQDRDNYILVYWDNIPQDRRHNFNKYGVGQADYYGHGYDAYSIMHYGNYAFSSNGKKTIDWKANTGLALSGDHLSAIDIGQLNALYKCNRNCDAFPYNLATSINLDVLRDQLNAGLRLLSDKSNADIAQRFWNYITHCQYPSYFATAAVYADVTGYEFHAFIGFGVSYQFRTYGHNFVVYTKHHSGALPSAADQEAVLRDVVAANTNKGCNAQANRDRAWSICHGRKCQFVLVVRHGYGVSGYHSLANSKWANYKCGRHCSFWSIACNDIYEFIYVAF